MWFNNALVFQYELDNLSELSAFLANDLLKPCPPHARFIYGWVPAMADELVQEVAGCALICMGKEERILPKSVIHRILNERVEAWETQQGRNMKRAEKAQLAEELEFELLPKSFCVQKKLYALFDSLTNRLIINSASPNQASQIISLLRKSVPNLQIAPLYHEENLSDRFAEWINVPASLPNGFQLASNCVLISPDDEKKQFNCKGYELPADEILSLLAQGLTVSEVSIIWNERIQFTLSQDFVIKRAKCLDYLLDEISEASKHEEEYQRHDAALTLLSGEFRELVNDLLRAIAKAPSVKEPHEPLCEVEA